MIVKRSGGYHVLSESGKNLGGPYSTRTQARARLAQVEMFKHMHRKKKKSGVEKSDFLYVVQLNEELLKARKRGAKDLRKRKKRMGKQVDKLFAAKMLGYDPEKDGRLFKARTIGAGDIRPRKKKLSKKRIKELREIEKRAQISFPFAEKLEIVKEQK